MHLEGIECPLLQEEHELHTGPINIIAIYKYKYMLVIKRGEDCTQKKNIGGRKLRKQIHIDNGWMNESPILIHQNTNFRLTYPNKIMYSV